MTQLSPHFSLDEFTRSRVARQHGIDNTPAQPILYQLQRLADCAEQVRQILGNVPLLISSGYRCPALNKAVGGVANSAHLTGLAMDFSAPAFGTPSQVARCMASSALEFDQLILERVNTAVWVHLGLADDKLTARRQILTIDHHGTRSGLWT